MHPSSSSSSSSSINSSKHTTSQDGPLETGHYQDGASGDETRKDRLHPSNISSSTSSSASSRSTSTTPSPSTERSAYRFPTSNLQPISVSPRSPEISVLSHGGASRDARPIVLVACGSFNPITNLHLRLFESARDYFHKELDRQVVGAYMSPVHDMYGKRKAAGLVSGRDRVHLCRLACGTDEHAICDTTDRSSSWVMVDDWEVRQKEFSRTREVLEHFAQCLKEHYGEDHNVQVVLLCGGDMLESFVAPGVWRTTDVEHILKHYGVATMEREGTSTSLNKVVFDHDVLYKYRRNIFVIPQHIENDISSSKIRAFINRGYSVRYFVPDAVIRYISKTKLFSDTNT